MQWRDRERERERERERKGGSKATEDNEGQSIIFHTAFALQGVFNQARATLTNRNSVVSKCKELIMGVCHEQVESILGPVSRCLFGPLAGAMAINMIFHTFKVNIGV
jgi:hypothetical protein